MTKLPLGDALEQIREGRDYQGRDLKPQIKQIRTQCDKEQRRSLKGQLPVLVFSGFSATNNKQEIEASHNGLICVDIDNLSEDQLSSARERLVADPHTLACFLSPSGNGLKVLHYIPFPQRSWTENFPQVQAYYRGTYQLEIDTSCKNINRLCYYSYDRDIYINGEATPLPSVQIPCPQKQAAPLAASTADSAQALERGRLLLEIISDTVGTHDEWIRFCGALSNYLQANGHTAEQALEALTQKWDSEQDRLQLKALVKDRRDTPLEAAEALARRCSPDRWKEYQARYLEDWPHWQRYVYDSVADEIVDVHSGTARTRRGFDLKYASDRPVVRNGDKVSTESPSTYTIRRCPEVAGREYAPAEARPVFVHENGERLLNQYRPVQYPKDALPDRVDLARELILGHINHLFSDEQEAALLLDYLAWCVQNPGQLRPWMVILYGVQGDGKSWFRELMEAALGEPNVGVLQSSNLEDKFASPAYGKCLTFVEELKLDNVRKYDTLERLKSLIGNRRISLREMRKAPREARATANYLAATNHSDSLPVSDNERRFCVLTSQWVNRKDELRAWVLENPDYYPRLYRMVREEPAAFRAALMGHLVSDSFLATYEAPRTRGTLRMIEEAMPAGAVELQNWISEWEGPWINDRIVYLQALKEKHGIESDPHTRHTAAQIASMPSDKRLGTYLKLLGYTVSVKRSVRLSGGEKRNITIYLKPGVDVEETFEAIKNGDVPSVVKTQRSFRLVGSTCVEVDG